MRSRMRVPLAVVVIAAATLALAGCKKDAAAGRPGDSMPTPEVGVVTLQPSTI
ncbi:MAG: efflux transporter periplasmic adaptor subunit, partial [Pseudomonadota bacterium]|nr:efflux transporter periplasmic adaptor subunit [Pseudomonadota bacterium]